MKSFLSIGLNRFEMPGNDLSCCVMDALDMQHVGVSMGAAARILKDGQATKAVAMSELTALVEQAKAGKLTYLGVSWSGHGTNYTAPDGGLAQAIVCYDTVSAGDDWNLDTIITETEFRDLVNQVPPSCTVEVWADLCFSQGLARHFGTNRSLHNPGNTQGIQRMADPDKRIHAGLNPNVIMWAACSADETAADAPALHNGAFTHAWLQAYMDDRKSSRLEVLLRCKAIIRAERFSQTPHLNAYNVKVQLPVGA